MKPPRKPFSALRRLILFGLLLSTLFLNACAVFSIRYTSWNHSVPRDADGVLSHAQPFSVGEGDTAILLIHGFGDGPHVWNALAAELAERGYHVRCMRLPGWNEPIEVKRTTRATDWEDAVVREWEALRSSHKRVVVMGHSLGGCVSVAVTQSGQIVPDALGLYAPLLEVSSARSPLLSTRTWYELGSNLLPNSMILESPFTDHTLRATPRPRTERDPFIPVGLYHELYLEMDRAASLPAQVPCPVRLVLPETDRVVEEQTTLSWFERLEAPDKQVHREKNSGHVLPLDLDPESESDRIDEWLKTEGIHI